MRAYSGFTVPVEITSSVVFRLLALESKTSVEFECGWYRLVSAV